MVDRAIADTVVLVTGSTDGIGKQTALELVRRGHHVIVHGRSAERVRAACEEVRRAVAPGPARVDGVTFDLASLEAVRAGALELLREQPALHVLINNAGTFAHQRRLTVDGLERTFAVNHLAPFLLTHLLLPRLTEAGAARVVNVSSVAHGQGRLDLDDPSMARGYDGYVAYATSKLANILHANALATRHAPARLTANSLHPGVITTKLLREGFDMAGDSLERGARTSVKLASDPELAGVSGRYFADERETRPSAAARDAGLGERLWDASLRMCGLA